VLACPRPAVVFTRDDPAASVEASRDSRNRRVDGPRRATRPERSSDVEQRRPRFAADLRKSSSTCQKNIDTIEQYDFRQRSASRFQFARQPNCLGRFVVHALQCTRKRQVR